MFRGEHNSSIDVKGRTSIPSRLREAMTSGYGDENLVITKSGPVKSDDGDFCRGLAIYPISEFRALEERFERNTGLTASELNSIRRLVLAPAVEFAPDRLGRVLVPPALRNYAAIDRDIVFVGMQNKIEVWDVGTWKRVCAQAERDYPADTPILAELGI